MAKTVSEVTLPQLASFITTELAVDGQVIGMFGNKPAVEAAYGAASARR